MQIWIKTGRWNHKTISFTQQQISINIIVRNKKLLINMNIVQQTKAHIIVLDLF